MKKILLAIILLCSVSQLSAQTQIIEKLSSYNSWSVSGDVGFNYFLGDVGFDPTKRFSQFMGSVLTSPGFNVSIEHNIDPVFSVGWTLGANFFHQTGLKSGNVERIAFNSFTSSPYLSANLQKILTGGRPSKWGVWFTSGVGFSGYSHQFTQYGADTLVDFRSRGQKDIKAANRQDSLGMQSTQMSLMIPFGFSVEYSLSEKMSIGAVARMVVTNSDFIESISRQNAIDVWENFGFVIRYKFLKSNQQHSRNVLYGQAPKSNTELIDLLRRDVDILTARLNDCNCNRIDTINTRLSGVEGQIPDPKVNVLEGRVKELEGQVPDPKVNVLEDRIRELEARKPVEYRPTTRDTIVIVKQVPVVQTVPAESKELPDVKLAVYFDFDKTDLDAEANNTILKVAGILVGDPTLKVKVLGYADNPGANNYNQRLSQRRSEKVKNELMKVYGISADRIVADGNGKIPEPPVQTRRNRRCDFIFSR